MDARECILTRRSIRRFSDKEVTRETVSELISVTEYAPTWKNVQANRFIAIYDKAIKEKIAKECTLGYEGNTGIIEGAPVLIAMTIVNKRSGYERDGSFSTTQGTHWESFDAGSAAQTLCLAAHEMGLGTVIMGIFDEKLTGQAINVPEGETVSALIALGYPAEEPTAPKRKDLEKILSFR